MTVSTTTLRNDYTGNGVTTLFTVGFYFLDNTHVQIIRTQISTGIQTTLALTTDYTLAGAGVSIGGTATLLVAPTSDQRISILRNVPFTQLVHYVPNDPFPAATHEQALDQLTMESQQLKESLNRAVTIPAGSTVTGSLPTPTASQLIGWDSTGTSLQNYSSSQVGVSIANANWSTSTYNGDGVTVSFVLPTDAGVASNCAVSVGGVVQAAGINFNYTQATKTIAFLTGAPPVGTNNVVVRYGVAVPQGISSNVAILSGTIDGTVIGGTNPAAVTATALTATGNTVLGDASTDTLNVGNGGIIKDASGNVGIGVTPSAWTTTFSQKAVQLTSSTVVSGDINSSNFATNWFSGGGGATYIKNNSALKYTQDGSDGGHKFYVSPAGTAGNPITFTQAMTLDASGNLGIGVAPTAGINASLQIKDGIKFPATQVPSTDPNTLDDYKEGTWTPTQGASLTVVGAFSSSGTYTKKGREVTINGVIVGATSIACSAGSVFVGGLPYTSNSYRSVGAAANLAITQSTNIVVLESNTSIWSVGAIAATPSIAFSATYFV